MKNLNFKKPEKMHQITERNKNLQTSTLQNEKLSSLRLAKLVQSFRKQEYGLKKMHRITKSTAK